MKNICVVGLGNHAINNILPAICTTEGLRLSGVISRAPSIRRQISRDFDCDCWANITDMFGDVEPDIVYISTPPATHVEIALQCLEQKSDVWIEKPIVMSVSELARLYECSAREGRCALECHMYKYHKQFESIKKLLGRKELGSIKNVNLRFGMPQPKIEGYRNNKHLGASALYDVGCYLFSVLETLFKGTQKEIIYSRLWYRNEIDNSGLATVLIDDEICCQLFWGYGISYRNEIDIWGNEGSLYSDRIFSKKEDYAPSIIKRDIYGTENSIGIRAHNHFSSMFRSFLCLSGREDELYLLEQENSLRVSRMLEKVKDVSHNSYLE